jgi:beta-N-acetylglucosaminidase
MKKYNYKHAERRNRYAKQDRRFTMIVIIVAILIFIYLIARGLFSLGDTVRKFEESSTKPREYARNQIIEEIEEKTSYINYIAVVAKETKLNKKSTIKEKTSMSVTKTTTTKVTTVKTSHESKDVAYPHKNSEPYEGVITEYTNLLNRRSISVSDMDKLIKYWTQYNTDSELRNDSIAYAYIKASKISGYDPIFLLALTGQEAGWDISTLHSSKCNPYSIAMYDSDPNQGYILGDNLYDGIINGAKWIKDNYYNESNEKTLYEMQNNGRIYSTDTNWGSAIASIMQSSYDYLEQC